MRSFLCLLLTFSSLPAQAALFGNDDRMDVTLASAYERDLGQATALAVLNNLVTPSRTIPGTSAIEDVGHGYVCADERFAADPSVSTICTAFLVAPDLVVTAGHCMSNANTGIQQNESGNYCAIYSFLFDYQKDAQGQVQLDGLTKDRLYSCKKIIYAVSEERAPFRDFALIQLDRPVVGRKPLKLAPGPVSPSERLGLIGFPFGTPMKIAPRGRVLLDNPARQSFLTNLNAFEGNSGSPVFNQRHEVVGILEAGTPSNGTVTDRAKSCERYNHCDENGQNCQLPDTDTSLFPGYQGIGSEVQRIAPVADLVQGMQ